MRSAKWIAAALLGCAAMATPAQAQIESGDKSISANALVFYIPDGNTALVSLQGGFSIFPTKLLGLHFSTGINVTSSDNSDTNYSGTLGVGAEFDFNFGEASTIPYVGLDLGGIIGTSGGNAQVTGSITPGVGLRTFLSRSTSIDMGLQYNVSMDDKTAASMVLAKVGFSYYFGKDSRK